jgi:uncharacterized repeat protein (TIGR01451 family)
MQALKMPRLAIIAALLATTTSAPLASPAEQSGTTPDLNPRASAAELQPDPVARRAALGAIPATGLLLVADSTNNRVLALNPQTGDVIDANFVPSDPTRLATPLNAILNASSTEILVSDQVNDVVQRYDLSSGAFLGTFAPVGGVNNTILDNIRGIELTPAGELLVTVGAGGNINAIARFSTTGDQLPPFVPSNSVPAIASPFEIYRVPAATGAIAAGEYLVTSSNTGAVTRFSANGALIGPLAIVGTFPQQVYLAANGNFLIGGFGVNSDGVYEITPAGVQVARLDDPTIGGYRGAYELANGNVLTTTGSGIYELNRSTGLIVQIKQAGIQARYIEFVRGAGSDVAISKTAAPAALSVNGTVEFVLTARNLSSVAASSVVVTDPIPAALSYLSSNCNASFSAGVLTWTIGNLAANGTQTCTVQTRAVSMGTVVNRATIIAAGADPQTSNNSAEATIQINGVPIPATTRLSLAILAGLMTLLATLWLGARRIG